MSAVQDDDLTRAPHPRLRRHLGDYVGYDVSGVPAGTHLGLPSGALTFIVTIDAPLRQGFADRRADETFDVLLAGLHLRPTLVRHEGAMTGIQINLSPFAPRALFGLTASEFTDDSVDLREISRPLAAQLHERVNAAARWSERFDAIDEVLLAALHEEAAPRVEVARAWQEIVRSRGSVSVTALAEVVGWSRRHLTGQLHAEVGIGPKDAARVMRFDRARRLVAANHAQETGRRRTTLAEIAAACGYADQSHLVRDFTDFAGTSPTKWLRSDPVAARG